MAKLNSNGITAFALSGKDHEKNDTWPKIENNEARVICMTPAVLLDKSYHLHHSSTGPLRHLVAVAIDGCDLAWDWEGFREKLLFVESYWKRANRYKKIPFVCLSASFTAGDSTQSYRPSIAPTVGSQRDNVNVVVSQTRGTGIQELLDLIPEGIRDPLQIPKAIIFYDRIDSGISIAKQPRARLSRILSISDVSAKATIPCIFASVDAKAKSVGLFNFREGKARIMIALDHWGLEIDAPDVETVIQWHVDERLDFSDLDQRIGKAAANPNLEGTAIVYVQNGLLTGISKSWKKEVINWEEAWRQPDLFLDDDSSGDGQRYSDADDVDEDGRTKRVWKQKPLGRFGLPVETDVQDKVALHRRYLYLQAKRARKARRLAEQERNRTGRRVRSTLKLDPGVLWFLCTQGCRHRPFGVVLKNSSVFEDKHRYWCCDNCAIANGLDISHQLSHRRHIGGK